MYIIKRYRALKIKEPDEIYFLFLIKLYYFQ